jgi:23S rRNA (adenine2503-C2)-methyltransferase
MTISSRNLAAGSRAAAQSGGSRGGEAPAPRRSSLLGLPLELLQEELAALGLEPYRARQLLAAIHRRGRRDLLAVTELPLVARKALAERYTLERPPLRERVVSRDGTAKYLFELLDGSSIETVDIPEGGRRTVCVSSQAGCALGCRFCVTGYWGAGRDLEASEIVGQVLAVREMGAIPPASLNLVFMGMGEPLLNLEAVHRSLRLLTGWLGWSRVTVSTAGVAPGIEAIARWPERPNLAVSLHAPDDERRAELMPINRRYPLGVLFEALRSYPATRHRPITFEYTLIDGFNDRLADVVATTKLIRGLHAKVNLIPLNPDPVLPAEMAPTPIAHAHELQRAFVERGVPCSVRRPRGDDVQAACGQLRAFARAPRGFPRAAARAQELTAGERQTSA